MSRERNLLHDMGTPAHIKGHYYLRSAILEVYDHPELLKNMMKEAVALAYQGNVVDLWERLAAENVNVEKIGLPNKFSL